MFGMISGRRLGGMLPGCIVLGILMAGALSTTATAAPDNAKSKVSITIEGDIDTLIHVLEFLQEQGYEEKTTVEHKDLDLKRFPAPKTELESNDAPVETSPEPKQQPTPRPTSRTTPRPTETAKAAETESAPAPEEEAPPVVLETPVLGQSSLAAGEETSITVQAEDPDLMLDTMTARLEMGDNSDTADIEFDLFETGDRDADNPAESTWKGDIAIPDDLPAGEYRLVVTPYKTYGWPIAYPSHTGGGGTVTTETTIEVTAP